jgi:orotate phosphoribosyltransferase
MSTTATPYKISNFIQDIVARNIIQFNKTDLSSARASSYYADFRQLLAYTDLENYVVSQIIKIMDAMTATGYSYDKIAAVAVDGVPWATLVGNKLNKPVSIIRISEKTHGKKAAIDGATIKLDDNVILIEDVLTTGDSVINAIRKIHNTGAVVTRVICILDRNEGAQEHIKYYFPDIKVSSILSINTIVSVCSANKLINDYTAEQIEFYRESGYTGTIKMLTQLNENAKELDYQKDPVKWQYDNFADVWNFANQHNNVINSDETKNVTVTQPCDEHNPLFVDVSNMDDWNEIKYKISIIGARLRNLVIQFEGINGWDAAKQDELVGLHKKYGFNTIYKSSECIAQSCVVDTTQYTIFNMLSTIQAGCKYPNSVLVNGIILNLYIDINPCVDLVTQLRDAINKYTQNQKFINLNIHNIFVNFIGPGVSEIIPNVEFWQEFRSYILSTVNNQILQIKGLIIPYIYVMKNSGILSRQFAIGRLMPLILDTSRTADGAEFYLEPSMLTDNANNDYVESLLSITKAVNSNGFTHLMVSNDLMESNTVMTTRITQYINFISSIILQKQNKTFSFIQMSNARSQYESTINNKYTEYILSKVNSFNEQQRAHVTESKSAVVNENVTVETIKVNTGVVAKCKEYLLNNTNRLLNLFGMTLAVSK